MHTPIRYLSATLTCLTLVWSPISPAQSGGGSPTLGGSQSDATGVSADGHAVVGWSDTSGNLARRGFRWTPAGIHDLGTLGGGATSEALGISADGLVAVGRTELGEEPGWRAFRWTAEGGMENLGTFGGTSAEARGASHNGATIVGFAQTTGNAATRAFRWTQGGGLVDLGTLGGTDSRAYGVSADGSVIVGDAHTAADAATRAFRWTSGGGMVDLGTLGGTNSGAYGLSADGAVVVGAAQNAGDATTHAFRWTSGGGMLSLGTLGGANSEAYGASADGSVVVGKAQDASGQPRAFRWQAGTTQSVEAWLRAAGVAVVGDLTQQANAVNADGSVVVGQLADNRAFIARVVPAAGGGAGSGLIALDDLEESLYAGARGGAMMVAGMNTLLYGAHSRPLARRVAPGRSVVWVAGDWGQDNHGVRDGDIGLAEVGAGYNWGRLQLNVSVAQAWENQQLPDDGKAESDGTYLVAEALVPLSGSFWGTFTAFYRWGEADLRRGYLNAGAPDRSSGNPDLTGWGLRVRVDWEHAAQLAGSHFTPYADLGYGEGRLDGYTESGGAFPARFEARDGHATELRLGLNSATPLADRLRLNGILEVVHRFEEQAPDTRGEVIGLYGFNLDGPDLKQDWQRIGIGLEGPVGPGTAALTLNATTEGGAASTWLAASWQAAF